MTGYPQHQETTFMSNSDQTRLDPDDPRLTAHALGELEGEEAARGYQDPVELVHYRGLADARISRDKHELGRTGGDDMFERTKECGHLTRATI